MQNNMQKPKRKDIRLHSYDYTSNSAYHVILCTNERRLLFSRVITLADEITPPQIELTETGKSAKTTIEAFNRRYSYIHITEFSIMANHIHLLVEYSGEEGETRIALGNFVSRLKSAVTVAAGEKIWERSFYEHVIRGERDYIATREYIQNNPSKWIHDEYYCENMNSRSE